MRLNIPIMILREPAYCLCGAAAKMSMTRAVSSVDMDIGLLHDQAVGRQVALDLVGEPGWAFGDQRHAARGEAPSPAIRN